MIKCALYPYSDALYPILENRDSLIDDLAIQTVVYPRAWQKLILHKNVLETITSGSDFEALITDAECVIFADLCGRDFMYSDTLEKVRYSLDSGKDIILCFDIKEDNLATLRRDFPNNKITLKYAESKDLGAKIDKHDDICCGAIGVGGIYRGLDNVAAVTGITRAFQNKEIHAVGVTPNATLTLLGLYQFPTYIFNSSIDIEQQAGKLNAFFKGLEKKTGCDLMVIQFPDGMMKYIPETYDAYGIKAFMLTRAVAFDYFVLNSFLDVLSKESYDCVGAILKKRFDLPLNACLFQPLTIDKKCSEEEQRIFFTRNFIKDRSVFYEDFKATQTEWIVASYDNKAAYDQIVEDVINKFS